MSQFNYHSHFVGAVHQSTMNNNIFKANMARTMHFVMHFKASDDRNRENTAPHGDVAESYILYVAANTVKRIFGIKDFNIHKFFLGIFDSNIFIHHVQNFGNEIGQADIAADGFPTHASVFAHFLRSQLRHNLCRS